MTGFHGEGALASRANEFARALVSDPAEERSTESAAAASHEAAGETAPLAGMSAPTISSQFKIMRPRIVFAGAAAIVLVFFGLIFFARQFGMAVSPEVYLYLEVGGTLLSFCYAANALVRFRGTHDRTALILAFGFVDRKSVV